MGFYRLTHFVSMHSGDAKRYSEDFFSLVEQSNTVLENHTQRPAGELFQPTDTEHKKVLQDADTLRDFSTANEDLYSRGHTLPKGLTETVLDSKTLDRSLFIPQEKPTPFSLQMMQLVEKMVAAYKKNPRLLFVFHVMGNNKADGLRTLRVLIKSLLFLKDKELANTLLKRLRVICSGAAGKGLFMSPTAGRAILCHDHKTLDSLPCVVNIGGQFALQKGQAHIQPQHGDLRQFGGKEIIVNISEVSGDGQSGIIEITDKKGSPSCKYPVSLKHGSLPGLLVGTTEAESNRQRVREILKELAEMVPEPLERTLSEIPVHIEPNSLNTGANVVNAEAVIHGIYDLNPKHSQPVFWIHSQASTQGNRAEGTARKQTKRPAPYIAHIAPPASEWHHLPVQAKAITLLNLAKEFLGQLRYWKEKSYHTQRPFEPEQFNLLLDVTLKIAKICDPGKHFTLDTPLEALLTSINETWGKAETAISKLPKLDSRDYTRAYAATRITSKHPTTISTPDQVFTAALLCRRRTQVEALISLLGTHSKSSSAKALLNLVLYSQESSPLLKLPPDWRERVLEGVSRDKVRTTETNTLLAHNVCSVFKDAYTPPTPPGTPERESSSRSSPVPPPKTSPNADILTI